MRASRADPRALPAGHRLRALRPQRLSEVPATHLVVAVVADETQPVDDPDNPAEQCFWHGYEPTRPGDYRACGECLHVWRTRDAYVASVHQLCREMRWPEVDELDMCPLCSHDW